MKFNILIKSGFYCLILIFAIFPSITVVLGDYPKPHTEYVNDFANVLTKSDSETIYRMFKDLEYKTGIEATVLTINSIFDYGTTDTTIESFATNLFNAWGIGHKKENNGILILVAVRDRKCRIELGAGYGRGYDSSMKRIIEKDMIPHFRAGDYSRGIYLGSHAVIKTVTTKVSWFEFYKMHLLIGAIIIFCIFGGISLIRSGKKGWGWFLLVAAGLLLLYLGKIFMTGKRTGDKGGGGGFSGGFSFGGGASGGW